LTSAVGKSTSSDWGTAQFTDPVEFSF